MQLEALALGRRPVCPFRRPSMPSLRAARYSMAVLDGIPGCSIHRREPHELADLLAFSVMEPTGIEPVTSCLQNGTAHLSDGPLFWGFAGASVSIRLARFGRIRRD